MTAASSQPSTSNESLSDPASHSSDEDHRRGINEKAFIEKHIEAGGSVNSPTSPVTPNTTNADLEKAAAATNRATNNNKLSQHPSHSSSSGSFAYGAIKAGRPDTATLIREAVSSTPSTGRVLVAACGPAGLMRTVRDTTASLIRGDGPAVELHCEEFGW